MFVLDTLRQHPIALMVVMVLLGLIAGSFLNVVIHRLPRMMESDWRLQCAELAGATPPPASRYDLWWPRSQCPQCGRGIGAADNIPIASYLLLHGRCRGCGAPIPARYPIVEALAGIVAAVAVWRFGYGITAPAAAAMGWALLALTFIDLDRQLLPDSITLPFLWAGLLLNLWGVFVPIEDAVVGAMAGYLTLWTVYWLFKIATGKEGMGHGDFKLLAMLGAWLGWEQLPAIILLSSLVGATVGIALMVFRGHRRQVPIPFGPYLAAAGFIALIYGDELTEAYWRWL
jgi:leader peptidase (prepilin peptidase)/N-methyltransferase